MEFTQALLIAVGSLAGGIIALWRISHLMMASRIKEQSIEIEALKAEIKKNEQDVRIGLERMVNTNVNIVESLLPLLEQIADKQRVE